MSKVQEWIKAQKNAMVASGNQARVKTSVTARLDDIRLKMLDDLSKNVGMTRSGFTEQLLELAINDAWETWHGHPITPQDVAQLERAARNKAVDITADPFFAFRPLRTEFNKTTEQYTVYFEARGMQAARLPAGEFSKVPSDARVVMSVTGGTAPNSIQFFPSDKPVNGITEEQYKEKAWAMIKHEYFFDED